MDDVEYARRFTLEGQAAARRFNEGDFDEARRLNRREICAIYNVPPWLVGSYATGREAIDDWKWWWRTWPRRAWRLLRSPQRREILEDLRRAWREVTT